MHADHRFQWTWRILRWVIGVPCLAAYPHLGVFSPFVVLFGAILIAPDLAELLASALAGFAGSRHYHQPRPDYGAAEAHAAHGRYAQAESEYEKIIRRFPDALKPHIDMIGIAVVRLNDRDLARKIYERGIRTLARTEDRDRLAAAYERILTRIKDPDKDFPKPIRFERMRRPAERPADEARPGAARDP
jgi:tetratricopeptide (TPR) repeat protein